MSEEAEEKGRETLARLLSRADLAAFLGVEPRLLKYMLYKLTPQQRYNEFVIRKRNGKARQIRAPIPRLRGWQSRIAKLLATQYKPPQCVYGYVDDRNILQNAARHEAPRWVLRVDLAGFFPSISFGRVRKMLMAKPFGLTPEVATTMATVCCYGWELPQGSPASPIISNILCKGLDYKLSKLARSKGCAYTRYCDDLVFSTHRTNFPPVLAQFADHGSHVVTLGAMLVNTIVENRFTINEEKTRLRPRSNRQMVTGLVVNKRINVPRTFVRHLRVILHEWEIRGPDAAAERFFANHDKKHRPPQKKTVEFARVVRGKVQYLGSIRGWDDFLYLKYAAWLSKVDKDFTKPTTQPRQRSTSRHDMLNLYVEGPTDKMHIEFSLDALKRRGLFKGLRLEIDGKNRGSGELYKICKVFSEKLHVPPCVFVFDNDEGKVMSQVSDKGQTMTWGNGVYSLVLPRPVHLPATEARWCIEMMYPEPDFMRADPDGRRLFLASEFKAQTNRHLSLEAYTTRQRRNDSSVVISGDVFAFKDERNLALSKMAFAKLIERQASGGGVDFEAFVPLFEELERLRDRSD